jgi:hypothetical protein
VIITSLQEQSDGYDGSSYWILDRNCTINRYNVRVTSALFVPQLTSVSFTPPHTLTKITLTGSLLINCSRLGANISLLSSSNVPINSVECEIAEFLSESAAVIVVPAADHSLFYDAVYVDVSLRYESFAATHSTLPLRATNYTQPQRPSSSSGTPAGRATLITVAVVLPLVVICVVIVVLVFVYRRRKHKRLHYRELPTTMNALLLVHLKEDA